MVWVIIVVRSLWKVYGVALEYVIMSVWLIMYSLCTLVFTCIQVYNDVVLLFMHEVMVCVVGMVMHR